MFRRSMEPLESEKTELQELNHRLGQYLLRARHLEEENSRLLTEVARVRQDRAAAGREHTRVSELRDARRLLERVSFEKSRAEMEREQLREELQALREMRSDEASVSRGVRAELKASDGTLRRALHDNRALEERLHELQHEHALLEEARREESAALHEQLRFRPAPHASPAGVMMMMEELRASAEHFTQSWSDPLRAYRRELEELEEGVRAEQARLEEIHGEKLRHAAHLRTLREELEEQTQVQRNLEDQTRSLQQHFSAEIRRYQAALEELETERGMISGSISQRLMEHQELLRVKTSLALEVAAYRALLEEEGRRAGMWPSQRSRLHVAEKRVPPYAAARDPVSFRARGEREKPVMTVSPSVAAAGPKRAELRRTSAKREKEGLKERSQAKEEKSEGEEKVLDSVSMQEILQQVIKPAGLDTKVGLSLDTMVGSAPDSKLTYHVERTEQEDGTTKTQIVLQSKVEEELDLDEDSALEELLSRSVKKVTLENIKGTAAGDMIESLLGLGLQGEGLENRSVNVEITEEPVDWLGEAEALDSSSVHYLPDEEPQEEHSTSTSTPEDAGRFLSYTHYGGVEDLSDERHYQDESPARPSRAVRSSLQESIVEEELLVSPGLQRSVVEVLTEPSLDPQQQLRGALEERDHEAQLKTCEEFSQTQMVDPHLKVCHEKRVATVYLQGPKDA